MEKLFSYEEVAAIAKETLTRIAPKQAGATVLALHGDLGAGKTTLTKELATLLGVTEMVQSPTFVMMKRYKTHKNPFRQLVHIDAYRIEDERELLLIGWEHLTQEPETLIVVEWPEKIQNSLPKDTFHITLEHEGPMRRIKHT